MKHTMLILLSACLLTGCSSPSGVPEDTGLSLGGGGAIPMPPDGSYEWALGLAEDEVGSYPVMKVEGVKINSSGCIDPGSGGYWYIYFDLGSEGYKVKVVEFEVESHEEWDRYVWHEDLEFVPDNEAISIYLSLHYDFGGTDPHVRLLLQDEYSTFSDLPDEMVIFSPDGGEAFVTLYRH